MREIASVELGVISTEIGELLGCTLSKFYDLGNGAFRFSFSSRDKSGTVYCKLLRTINLTSFLEEAGEATNFAMAMRKRILGAKLAYVRQYRSDRILIFGLDDAGGKYELVFEMFGKGNLLLLKEGYIELCYRIVKQREREIRPGIAYAFPKGGSALTIDEIDYDAAKNAANAMSATGKKLIAAFGSYFSFGPLYSDDIMRRAGLDPNADAASIKGHEDDLAEAVVAFKEKLANVSPRIYIDKGGFADYAICDIWKYSGLDYKAYKSLSEALDEFYLAERTKKGPDDTGKNKVIEIKASMQKQEEIIRELEASEKKDMEIGNKIFERMDDINSLIKEINLLIKKREISSSMTIGNIKVKSVNLKEKKVTIDID
ncbi:MAG: NFACT family protein [Candidatus Micrarchaeaceae archaeon]